MLIAVRTAIVLLLVAGATACHPRPRPVLLAVSASEHWCPMHPGIRGAAGDRCPICQMALVPVASGIGDTYALDVELAPPAPSPGVVARARFQVRDPRTGAAVTQFDVVHEKLFHLFVVSRDLQHFAHLHPSLGANGAFDVSFTLPHPGHYQLMADLVPTGGAPQMIQRIITTAGYEGPLHEVPALTADLADKVVGNTRVQLAMREPVAGGERLMTFTLLDEPSGAPASDIEPYLGAPGHLVSVSADLSAAAHSHPVAQGGPTSSVAFQLLFPRAGMQRVWVQFQRSGRVFTASFTIPVDERQRTGT
jgi:hypothetical protein